MAIAVRSTIAGCYPDRLGLNVELFEPHSGEHSLPPGRPYIGRNRVHKPWTALQEAIKRAYDNVRIVLEFAVPRADEAGRDFDRIDSATQRAHLELGCERVGRIHGVFHDQEYIIGI